MRKTTFNLIAIGVVTTCLILMAVAVVGSFINSLVDEPERPPFKIVSSAPRQTYAVSVERKQREYTKEDTSSWKIYLSYASQGQQVLNEVEVDAGDASSSPYWDERPQLNWIYENTFRLDDTASSPESESDVLFVRNDSASALSYLYVNGEANERFFILNLEPQASVKLYARPIWKRGDSSWFSGSGQFINGGKVHGGKNFRLPHSAKGPGRYCLSVKENAITVVSRDFEGYELREFTPEERKQNEEERKKFEASQGTEVDGKKFYEIYIKRPEIITPKSPDCGDANSVSPRR
jgi:hypothetical protein